MKFIINKTFLLITIALLLVIMAGPVTAQVYKTVDEDGNVTYTDQPPGDGSQPIELKPLSIIEAPIYEKREKVTDENVEVEGGEKMSLRDLRKNFRDFAIVAPKSEESVWRPERLITVAWNVGHQLQPGMNVTVSVDGVKRTPSSAKIIPVTGLERGEHTVTAELKDAKNRRIATAGPVTFFIRRPGIYNRPATRSDPTPTPTPTPNPKDGG